MATRKSPVARSAATSRKTAAKRSPTKRAKAPKARAKTTKARATKASPRAAVAPDFAALAKGAKLVSPEQAIELYKANTRMALDVINAAIESAARVRKLQFEGVEQARAFGQRQLRKAGEAKSADAMVAAGQGAAREAIEHAMGYWSQMFDLIVEIQRRLFTLIEDQMSDVPGVKEARAAMAMMPDMSQAQNVIRALQGVVSSSGGAVEQMQKVMGDLARMGNPGRR
ncbi:MAG TPA: phasin family protein [Casimicrobiaceae bacterium]